MSLRALDPADAGAALAFLDARVSKRGPTHWRWKYRLDAGGAPTAFYWQEADGQVLGFVGLMRTVLHAGAARHPAAWFVDWHVTPGDRAVGVGLGLLRKAEAAAGILLTLQGSADTRNILPRLGWKQAEAPHTWVRPLSPRFAAAHAARSFPAPLRSAAATILAAGARGAAAAVAPLLRIRPPAAPAGAALLEVDRVPSSYDGVWAARAGEYDAVMARDSAYLNYLCADYPDRGYRIDLLRAGTEIVGHVICRRDPDRNGLSRGRIVDVVWPRSDARLGEWLVASTCRQLQADGADYVECVAPRGASSPLAAALEKIRFRPRRPVAIWYHRLPAGVPPPERWHISLLDCDRAYR